MHRSCIRVGVQGRLDQVPNACALHTLCASLYIRVGVQGRLDQVPNACALHTLCASLYIRVGVQGSLVGPGT